MWPDFFGSPSRRSGTTSGPHENHERYRTCTNDNDVFPLFRSQIDVEAEPLGEPDDGFEEDVARLAGVVPGDEGTVDLEDVDRQLAQVADRGGQVTSARPRTGW